MADPIRSLLGKIQDLRRVLAGQRRRADEAERALDAQSETIVDLRRRVWLAEASIRSLLERCDSDQALIQRDVYAVALRDLAKRLKSDDLDGSVAEAVHAATLQRAELVRLALQGSKALLDLDRLRATEVAPTPDLAKPAE